MLELALTWVDVEQTAINTTTCIRPGLTNHDAAQQDWEESPGRVEYWLSPERNSYSRVIRLTTLWLVKPLWLLDYCVPFTIQHVNQVAQIIDGFLLVARAGELYTGHTHAIEGIFGSFPFPAIMPLKGLNYVARSLHEQEWVVIQGQNQAALAARVAKESVVYED